VAGQWQQRDTNEGKLVSGFQGKVVMIVPAGFLCPIPFVSSSVEYFGKNREKKRAEWKGKDHKCGDVVRKMPQVHP